MREKIAEIVCKHCEKLACPFKSKGLMCVWLEDYVLKELEALIASEQADREGEQPTPTEQMPLIEKLSASDMTYREIQAYNMGAEEELRFCKGWLPAHDAEVASKARAEFAEILTWIAEHLTHIHINAIGDKMDIDYIDKEGHTQSYTYNDPECEETYQEMLIKAVAHIKALAEEGR